MDPNIKQSIIDRLKQTNNVLVTVKSNPTVDQLAACIALTLFLNKQGKHATAVFSGAVPSTIEFLKPEETLEKDTNSLRDFIIALDKSKADKLRYKVEDKVVKIFITPYRTSLTSDDLDFSQGDFNVDVVVALGVHTREELDQAIVAHGRILHDATVVSINNSKAADLGALNWNDDKASSLCEMTAGLVEGLQPNSLDSQIATAFLTGIVAETDRFSNPKTTSVTMSLSAKLMAAGANQQLVATRLQEPVKVAVTDAGDATQKEGADGTLEISHPVEKTTELPEPVEEASNEKPKDEIHIDEEGNLKLGLQDEKNKEEEKTPPTVPGRLALDPPTMGGTLTANSQTNPSEPSIDPLGIQSNHSRILSHEPDNDSDTPELVGKAPVIPDAPLTKQKGMTLEPVKTLSSIEEEVKSPHLADVPPPPLTKFEELVQQDKQEESGALGLPPQVTPVVSTATGIDDARKAVEAAALSNINSPIEPVQSLNAQPLGQDLHNAPVSNPAPIAETTPLPAVIEPTPMYGSPQLAELNLPPTLVPPDSGLPQEQTGNNGLPATPPPPVPPPMMPPNFGQPSNDQNSLDAPL